MLKDAGRHNEYVELKNLKRLRIFIAILFAFQIFLTSEPFAEGISNGKHWYFTAFDMAMRIFSAQNFKEFAACAIYAVFLVFPAVCFFFYAFDKKSNVKSFLSIACSIICTSLITFEIKGNISSGSPITLLLYLVIMFLSVVLMLATVSYNRELSSK